MRNGRGRTYGFGAFSAHTRNIPALEFPTSIPVLPSISEQVSTHTRSPMPREVISVTRADTRSTRPASIRAAEASRRIPQAVSGDEDRTAVSSSFPRIPVTRKSLPSRRSPSEHTVATRPSSRASSEHPSGTQRVSTPNSSAAIATSFFQGMTRAHNTGTIISPPASRCRPLPSSSPPRGRSPRWPGPSRPGTCAGTRFARWRVRPLHPPVHHPENVLVASRLLAPRDDDEGGAPFHHLPERLGAPRVRDLNDVRPPLRPHPRPVPDVPGVEPAPDLPP